MGLRIYTLYKFVLFLAKHVYIHVLKPFLFCFLFLNGKNITEFKDQDLQTKQKKKVHMQRFPEQLPGYYETPYFKRLWFITISLD